MDTALAIGTANTHAQMQKIAFVLGYVNPWTIFSNLAVNLDTSVALPDSSWGIAGGTWITDQVYVCAARLFKRVNANLQRVGHLGSDSQVPVPLRSGRHRRKSWQPA